MKPCARTCTKPIPIYGTPILNSGRGVLTMTHCRTPFENDFPFNGPVPLQEIGSLPPLIEYVMEIESSESINVVVLVALLVLL